MLLLEYALLPRNRKTIRLKSNKRAMFNKQSPINCEPLWNTKSSPQTKASPNYSFFSHQSRKGLPSLHWSSRSKKGGWKTFIYADSSCWKFRTSTMLLKHFCFIKTKVQLVTIPTQNQCWRKNENRIHIAFALSAWALNLPPVQCT